MKKDKNIEEILSEIELSCANYYHAGSFDMKMPVEKERKKIINALQKAKQQGRRELALDKDCDVCGKLYLSYHDDKEIEEADRNALANGNRCADCLEKYGKYLYPDNL